MDNILYHLGGLNINNLLPAAPFFNGAQIFASNSQVISFQNGAGVRFLTEYAQSAASVNKHDLFYHFHEATRDGACTSLQSSPSPLRCWQRPVAPEPCCARVVFLTLM